MVSIICIYNDEEKLKKQLLQSINKFDQDDIELVVLDSRIFKFKSCAEGLNYGVMKSSGDILLFSHQDIYIKEEKDFWNFIRFVQDKPAGSIIGGAGAIETTQNNYCNYTTGEELKNDNIYYCDAPKRVSCIDESFFAMKRETYEKHKFDEVLCDDWHLYAVEYSLYTRKYNNEVYVYPIQLHHFSVGKISINYMKGLIGIADFYRNDFKYIWTTCYKIRNSYIYTRLLLFVWILHRKLTGRSLQ